MKDDKDRFKKIFKKILTKNNLLIFLSLIVVVPILIFTINNSTESSLKMVSGTEYISGEEGQIIVRLDNEQGKPITDAECIVSLLYPDKSFFFTDRKMQQTSVPGNYYVAFITPSREGVYEEHIRCIDPKNLDLPEKRISNSFHVSSGLNMIREISISQRDEFTRLFNLINESNQIINNEIKNIKKSIHEIDSNFNESNNNVKSEIASINKNVDNLKDDLDKTNLIISSYLEDIEKIVTESQNTSIEKFNKLGDAITEIFGE